MKMRTPGWTGGRTRRGPVVQVRPMCRSCSAPLAFLSPGQIPVRSGEPAHGQRFRVVNRVCGCGESNGIKVREEPHE